MAEDEAAGVLTEATEGLELSLEAAAGMAAVFDAELARMRAALSATGQDIATLERGFSRGLRRAFDDLVLDGASLSDALDGLAQTMIRTTYSAAVKPVTDHLGGLLGSGVESLLSGLLPFASGAAFSEGRVVPFASGGVVRAATAFAMRGATGLMGEAGPEAILPLARGADGKLGVRSGSAGAVNLVMNVTTPDVAGFRRSRGQIAAQMSRALGRGRRNL
ncbi:phage tail tape measure protein [Pseudodonghicola flavimaris]|uniref:Phage tail tape measure protein n=1 Tax=Pseudodonghicola flavimaris TaxID=3050036 RepID=A0ABT7F3W5_9RHOB|nr:phage tail tape measure protein [Pseudodonghicola flavimaris]MDK3019288.1 phage tail tape measure protein [Pseudodonghicola flavimaris]